MGQADKKNHDFYTAMPSKFSTLQKQVALPQIDSILENLEIKMVCKDVMHQVISSIEERDPHHLALEVFNNAFDAAWKIVEAQVVREPPTKII